VCKGGLCSRCCEAQNISARPWDPHPPKNQPHNSSNAHVSRFCDLAIHAISQSAEDSTTNTSSPLFDERQVPRSPVFHLLSAPVWAVARYARRQHMEPGTISEPHGI
jgi:hypothetical protein